MRKSIPQQEICLPSGRCQLVRCCYYYMTVRSGDYVYEKHDFTYYVFICEIVILFFILNFIDIIYDHQECQYRTFWIKIDCLYLREDFSYMMLEENGFEKSKTFVFFSPFSIRVFSRSTTRNNQSVLTNNGSFFHLVDQVYL